MLVNREDFPVPNLRNLVGLVGSISLSVLLLALASEAYRASDWIGLIIYAVLFSFINNTNFSFLHESVHGIMNSNRRLNNALGCVSAAFFPTSFTLQQFFHLGHHCRNRTDAEMFDLYYPQDNVWMKRLVIYAMPSGIYWLSAVAGNLLFLFCPWSLQSKSLRSTSAMRYSSFDRMLSGVPESGRTRTRIRRQIALTIVIQASIIFFFDIALSAWLCCYWLFGMNWGALQYTDHAFSKRDIRNGAWNLRVNPLSRLIFLNYHLHLAHHQYPFVPWIYLPKLVNKDEERPLFWSNFLKLLSGPYPAEETSPIENDEFQELVYEDSSWSKTAQTPDDGHRVAT